MWEVADPKHLEKYFRKAQEEAEKSGCKKRFCGAVIIKGGEIIGRGFNSPPKNLESQRRCGQDKSKLDEKVTDKTCCIHAEERAIFDALKRGKDLEGGVIYFTSVDQIGNRLYSGEPFCTICSKRALDVGIKGWVLEHESGTIFYSAEEYNELSYNHHH